MLVGQCICGYTYVVEAWVRAVGARSDSDINEIQWFKCFTVSGVSDGETPEPLEAAWYLAAMRIRRCRLVARTATTYTCIY